MEREVGGEKEEAEAVEEAKDLHQSAILSGCSERRYQFEVMTEKRGRHELKKKGRGQQARGEAFQP